jgi:hypothetical protein
MPSEDLARFHKLVLAGHVPGEVTCMLRTDVIEFNWEPDGSGIIWDNEKFRTIPIDTVWFNFALQAPLIDDPDEIAVPEGFDRAFYADQASFNFAISKKLSSIEIQLRTIAWRVGLIACVQAVIVAYRYWR